MVTQEKQVFYVTDPSDKRWSIILQGKHIPHNDENHDLNFDILSTFSYVTQMSMLYEDVDRDVVHAIRNSHEEGIWEN